MVRDKWILHDEVKEHFFYYRQSYTYKDPKKKKNKVTSEDANL
jgi:hypothetical protein